MNDCGASARRRLPGRFTGRFVRFLALLQMGFAGLCGAQEAGSQLVFFETKIRPLLADHCYSCHSAAAEKLKGGLYLDSLEGQLKGGELGPAIVPGDPGRSLLIKAVRYTDPDLQMPPKGRKLSDRQIADLTQWVQSGSPWPEAGSSTASKPAKSTREISEQDRSWWSFQPIRRPTPPSSNGKGRGPSALDAFVRAGLRAKGLEPNEVASPRELVRRAFFDLIGLPPSPEQIQAFEKDHSAQAWSRLIDQLLSMPQYGERWGRHWLDVARFAQSNGYERDGEKPEAWRYRDYVVKAFNEDKPYDQFVKEQIAGDELEPATFDSIVATGFQRLGVWDDEPDDKRMAEFDELDDVLSTTGSAFLGLTIGCARCHDHKFDPIPQADYYKLLSFFQNVRPSEAPARTLDSANYVPLLPPQQLRDWEAARNGKLKMLNAKLVEAASEAEKKNFAKQIEEVKLEAPSGDWAMAVKERQGEPPPTHVLIRGNAGSPGAEVQPAFLSVLGSMKPALPTPAPDAMSSGRRKALAEWIASPANPLTARVMANRVWKHHFGHGLVKTTSDFGRAGSPPSNPQLLDWLAAELIENGWSLKKLHKTIMLSETYRMSSKAANAKAEKVDPGNELLWRQNLRRLESEPLRDTVLAISGSLNPRMGGRGFFPRLSGEVLAGQSRPGLDWEISSQEELMRRSLYAYVRRTMSVPMLDAFDYSNTTSPLNERPVTTVAPQSLLLLNDDFMQQQAFALLERLEREAIPKNRALEPRRELDSNDLERLIRRGFQLAVGRDPDKRERRLARDFILRQKVGFSGLGGRMTFRPEVPNSLSVAYMGKLNPEHFLTGPSGKWTYSRGRWAGDYEGIRTMERDRGPFALLSKPEITNGVIEAKVELHTAIESGGLLFRAASKDDVLIGYELTFEPREKRLSLRRHNGELVTLAQVAAHISTSQSLPVKIQLAEDRIRVWLGGESKPVFDLADAKPVLGQGRVGVRVWGAALSVDDLMLRPEGLHPSLIRDDHLDPPERRALQSFCLLLLNLNEVVYVD